jgi:hypothetical protein
MDTGYFNPSSWGYHQKWLILCLILYLLIGLWISFVLQDQCVCQMVLTLSGRQESRRDANPLLVVDMPVGLSRVLWVLLIGPIPFSPHKQRIIIVLVGAVESPRGFLERKLVLLLYPSAWSLYYL